MTAIAVLVGNPQPASRTTRVAEEVAAQIAERAGAEMLPTIGLAAYADRVFVFPEPELDALPAAESTTTNASSASGSIRRGTQSDRYCRPEYLRRAVR